MAAILKFIFFKKKIFFCFILMLNGQSFLVSKDGSKFWSSQMWHHILTQTKHFEGDCNHFKIHHITDSNIGLLSDTSTWNSLYYAYCIIVRYVKKTHFKWSEKLCVLKIFYVNLTTGSCIQRRLQNFAKSPPFCCLYIL